MPLQSFRAVLNELVCAANRRQRNDLNRELFKIKFQPPTSPPPTSDQASTSMLMPVFPATELFLHFRLKEASGIPLLGTFLAEVARQLSARVQVDHSVDMQFPVVVDTLKRGQKPACDGALCAILKSSHLGCQPHSILPVVLYEYKPIVDTRLLSVNPDDLMEMFIQGYYCLCQYKLETIIHCLTDLQQWYYFQLRKESARMRCMWYNVFHSETPEEVQVASHVHFLDLCTSQTNRA